MDKNYIEVDGTVLVNLRGDTLSDPSQLAAGITGHLRTGEKVTGTGTGGSVLNGKIATFNGDSICAGAGNNGEGYPEIIESETGMTVENIAVGGATITPGTGAVHIISTSISDMRSDADFIILEGGVNDADLSVAAGSISEGYTATLNTSTFAGAFENMIKSALARFPGKKIGYIFVHKCVNNFNSNNTAAGSLYYIAKNCCEKWGIPYLDLNTQAPPLGYVDALRTAYTNSGDGYHPNVAGYNAYYVPKIVAWMKTL